MEVGGPSSKLWIVADGQRVERAARARGADLGSGSPVVFVDDAAEYVAPADLAGAWLVMARQRGYKLASAVRASLVVVADVVGEHRL